MRSITAALGAIALVCFANGQEFKTFFFDQQLDHFDSYETRTYSQKYLVADQYWRRPTSPSGLGPIFLYTGNEGPIELFANNTGFMWDLAREGDFQPLLVFMEHRYFGASIPFGPQVFKDPKSGQLQWLTSEQALADYSVLMRHVKETFNATDSPVIAFGGSYGGMLAAWFRMKYPEVVDGSIAASAPVKVFPGIGDPEAYTSVLSRTWENSGPHCGSVIGQSWSTIASMGQTAAGRQQLADALGLCAPPTSAEDVTTTLWAWLSNAWQYMAMADYPYPASFLGPMPAWPVQAACKYLDMEDPSPQDMLRGLRGAVNIYLNYTGEAGSCFPLSNSGPSTLKDAGGWNYLACTELLLPVNQDGWPTDIMYPAPWDLKAYSAACNSTYGVPPRPNWVSDHFSVRRLRYATNIVFSNGNLDPWSGNGVTANVTGNPSLVAILIEDGAHHLDLRSAHPDDPQSVIDARNIHRLNIRNWIAQADYEQD
jgi:lysosomal Pro-X carboxypeptidase